MSNLKSKFTTVQMTHEISKMLGLIAASYERSKTAQLAWMVRREYDALRKNKLVAALEDLEKQETP